MENPKKIVVCGGGVIGVCTAYFLSKKGAAVTLIEKSSIACAASGKAGGFLALDWCDNGPLSTLARVSFNLHRSLSSELDGPLSYGYRPLTTLSLTVSESQKPTGDPISPPWIDGAVQGMKAIGNTETTAQVHPQLFTKTLLSKAVENYGVEIVIGKLEKVTVEEGSGVESVVLEDGREINADAVVLALGPWSGKLEMLSSLFRVYGLKAHSIILKPKEPEAITPHALFLNYHLSDGGKSIDPEIYPRPTGEVYLCGMAAEAEVPEDIGKLGVVWGVLAVFLLPPRQWSPHRRGGESETILCFSQPRNPRVGAAAVALTAAATNSRFFVNSLSPPRRWPVFGDFYYFDFVYFIPCKVCPNSLV